MPKLSKLFFASSNQNKFQEASKILRGFDIELNFFRCDIEEIQSDSIAEIALRKAQWAYDACKNPVIVEDDGLFVDSLGGFPGPYSSYVFDKIGNDGILRLVDDSREASFVSVIAYCGPQGTRFFEGKVSGRISRDIQGKGWGYDPIFIPEGQSTTFANLDKNRLSHRFRALERFAAWFADTEESTCRQN